MNVTVCITDYSNYFGHLFQVSHSALVQRLGHVQIKSLQVVEHTEIVSVTEISNDGGPGANETTLPLCLQSSNCFLLNEQVNDGENETGSESENVINLASSLMEECKAELSLANLDTVIFLFHQVLDRCPISHPLHSNAMRDLASALGIRFMYTNQINDVQESLVLYHKALEHDQGTSNVSVILL